MMVMEKPVVRRHLRSGAGEVFGDLRYIKVKERKVTLLHLDKENPCVRSEYMETMQ